MGKAAEGRALRLAADQLGVLHRRQARAAGMTDRQVEYRVTAGDWRRVFPQVYRVAGAPRAWRQQLVAASLWAGRGSALSHETAGALLGFARCPEGPIELTVTRHLTLPPPARVHEVHALLPSETTLIEGLRVTNATRTLVDLSATEDPATVKACVDEALQRRWTTLVKLDAALARATHHRGVAVLRPLVDALRGGNGPTESELERRVLDLLDLEGLPRPVTQARVVVGGRLRRLDFRFPGSPVVIEADGYACHSSVASFERDRERDNALIARGYRVLHWTWAALRHRPDELTCQLRRVLAARST